MKTKNIITGLIGAALLAAPWAKANLIELTITDATSLDTVAQGALTYGAGTASTGGYTSLDGWTFSINAATAPADGTLGNPYLEVDTILVSAVGTGNLVIAFGGTDYSNPDYASLNAQSTSLRGTFAAYYDPANGLLVQNPADLLASVALSPSGALASGGLIGSTSYSLTEVVTITGGNPGSLDTILTVPDGGMTLMMLGTAMIGLTVVRPRLGRRI